MSIPELRVYEVLSVLLYVAETWHLKKTLASRVHGFECHPIGITEVCTPILCLMKSSEGVTESVKHSLQHRFALCSLALLRPSTTSWPPYQNHLPFPPAICKLATTSRQTMQPLEGRILPVHPADYLALEDVLTLCEDRERQKGQSASCGLNTFTAWDLAVVARNTINISGHYENIIAFSKSLHYISHVLWRYTNL